MKRGMIRYFTCSMCVFLYLFNYKYALTGTLGTIKGQVSDANTGLSLPGAKVQIVGKKFKAFANGEGDYFINVPPGSYSVSASFIGYETKTDSNISVSINSPTIWDFKLVPTKSEIDTSKWSGSLTYHTSLFCNYKFGRLDHFKGKGPFKGKDIYDDQLTRTDNIVRIPFSGFEDDGLDFFHQNHYGLLAFTSGNLRKDVRLYASASFEDNPTSFPQFGTKLIDINSILRFELNKNVTMNVRSWFFDHNRPFAPYRLSDEPELLGPKYGFNLDESEFSLAFDTNKIHGSNPRYDYWIWKYNLSAFPRTHETGYKVGVNWTHTLSPKTFYELRLDLLKKNGVDATIDEHGNKLTLESPDFNSFNLNQRISTIVPTRVGYFDRLNE